MDNLRVKSLLTCIFLAWLAVCGRAQDLASFEKRVTVKVLRNGLTVIVCERHEAPVFSYFTHVDVTSDREVPGITGLAHMFEHMAFKGTDRIGTTNYAAEQVALRKVEAAYKAYDLERRKPVGRDEKKLAELEKAWKDAMAAADKHVVKNEFFEILEREGAAGINAFTSWDETAYYSSFPVNRLELWAYLESERFLKPVMREFYKERDVVMEEHRRRQNQPFIRLFEQFFAVAFIAHSYRRPLSGWPSDLETFSATDAMNFYRQYYVPANMIVTVVGDVQPTQVFPIVQKYFARLPAGTKPEPVRTVEPKQIGERQIILRETTQPWYLEGYQKPDIRHPDDAVYEAIQDLMTSGRTSRLYRALVRDKKIAVFAGGFNGWPGVKYPNLFAFYAVLTPGHKPEEVRDGIRAEIERVKNEDVTDEELKMIKTRAKANLIRGLDDNEGLAQQLAIYHARFGDWRELFRQVNRIVKVTKEDIRRVAKETFVASNRTVGIIESTQMAGASAKGEGQ